MKSKEAIFKKIFMENYHLCCIHANKYVRDPNVAKDIVQDVFLNFWIEMGNIDLSFSVRPLLYRYITNHAIDYLRKLVNRSTCRIENETLDDLVKNLLAEDQLDEIIAKEMDLAVESCIEKLPAQCKKVYRMSREDNMKNKEIADSMGISVKAVEKHITKALAVIRNKLMQI